MKVCVLLLNRNLCYIVYICPVAGSIADEAAMEIPAAVVAYHYPCHDGIFAALAAHLHFATTGAAVRFVPNRVFAPCTAQDLQLQVRVLVLSQAQEQLSAEHCALLPRLSKSDIQMIQGSETVFLLDYAGPVGFAAAAAGAVPSGGVYLLDHHKTAAEQLQGADIPSNLHITMDQSRSGAVIALEHFRPQVRLMKICRAHSDASQLLSFCGLL